VSIKKYLIIIFIKVRISFLISQVTEAPPKANLQETANPHRGNIFLNPLVAGTTRVTETIFTGSREFTSRLKGDNFSKPDTYRVCPSSPLTNPPPIVYSHSYRKHCRASWRLAILQN
jgi:hypothetical protein